MTHYDESVKKSALALHQQGQSVRAIAHSISVGKSTIDRWIKAVPVTPPVQPPARPEPAPTQLGIRPASPQPAAPRAARWPPRNPLPVGQPSLAQPTPTNARLEKELRQRLQRLDQHEQQLVQQTRQAARQLSARQKKLNAWQQELEEQAQRIQQVVVRYGPLLNDYAAIKLQIRQDMLMDRYHDLLQEVIDHCDHSWRRSTLADFIQRGKALGKEVSAMCGEVGLWPYSLRLGVGLQELVNEMGQAYEKTSGLLSPNQVTLADGAALIEFWESYRVTTFTQPQPFPLAR